MSAELICPSPKFAAAAKLALKSVHLVALTFRNHVICIGFAVAEEVVVEVDNMSTGSCQRSSPAGILVCFLHVIPCEALESGVLELLLFYRIFDAR